MPKHFLVNGKLCDRKHSGRLNPMIMRLSNAITIKISRGYIILFLARHYGGR